MKPLESRPGVNSKPGLLLWVVISLAALTALVVLVRKYLKKKK